MSCNTTVLCVLDHQIAAHRDPETGVIALDTFKMVYVAPMKALVQECVLNFGKRLAAFGITATEAERRGVTHFYRVLTLFWHF